jgi:hypothetical protein
MVGFDIGTPPPRKEEEERGAGVTEATTRVEPLR